MQILSKKKIRLGGHGLGFASRGVFGMTRLVFLRKKKKMKEKKRKSKDL